MTTHEQQERAVKAALATDREESLRDVFAASALGAIIVAWGRSCYEEDIDTHARRAYKYADAMLKARKQ
jgi:hypothetical protein